VVRRGFAFGFAADVGEILGTDGGTDAGLARALAALGLRGELGLSGRWLELRGERFPVYVVEASGEGAGFYTWCDGPGERAVEFHRDPAEAIRSGLRRAARAPREPRGEGLG